MKLRLCLVLCVKIAHRSRNLLRFPGTGLSQHRKKNAFSAVFGHGWSPRSLRRLLPLALFFNLYLHNILDITDGIKLVGVIFEIRV